MCNINRVHPAVLVIPPPNGSNMIVVVVVARFVGDKFNTNMSWTIISVGVQHTASLTQVLRLLLLLKVIFPISQGIGMAFKRREQALGELGNLLGNLKQVPNGRPP